VETQVTDEVLEQQENTQEHDDAAFAAGFAEARGDEPPTQPEPQQEAAESNEPQQEEAQAEPEAEPAEEPLYAGLTESQLKAALAKVGEVDEVKMQVRQAFGKLGEMNQKLMAAQNAGSKLSPGQLKRLSSEFPEMAALLEEDLSSLSVGGGQPSFDPTPLQQELMATRQELARTKAEQEVKLLSMQHRDWQQVAGSDDFKVWSQTLPQDERQKLNDSWDALYLSDKLSEFKSWRDKAQTSKQQKTQRLAAAVTPSGVPKAGPNSINDDDAFYAGWKSVRG
jgi:hypothetical protein